MTHRFIRCCLWIVLAVVVDLVATPHMLAQGASGSIRGQVTDPSGAAVTNATIQVIAASGPPLSVKSNGTGMYEVKGLTPGKYTVKVAAKGFAEYVTEELNVVAGTAQRRDISLEIQTEQQNVTVSDQGTSVDVNPSSNASAVVLTGKDLDVLSDDPDDLQSDLEALAGPSAGPNGGQMYIDGFTAGQLPPKASIREIRINQNPFSSEYDKLGYGRIEIFTKPGTDKFHGQFFVDGNSSSFNALNPFLNANTSSGSPLLAPSYESTQFNGSLGGPINKKASFFVDVQRRNINDESVINAFNPDPTLTTAVPFSASFPNSRTRTTFGPRVDYQVSKNNTLTVRYQFWRDTETNQGVGQFALASQGYSTSETEHTLQIGDTQTFGTKIVNETRFQYIRDGTDQTPLSTAPTINVQGAFTSGGNTEGRITDQTNRYELQNYTSMALGKHIVKFGGRLRTWRDVNQSSSNFNGMFTFSSLAQYQAAEQATASGQPIPTAELPNQFSITCVPPCTSAANPPKVGVTVVDGGLYAQDDWRLRPNLTLSYGLRFETQNEIHDHADLAPRIAIAWGMGRKGSTPKTVVRAGFGLFYERFTEELDLRAEQLNGTFQRQYVVPFPTFYPSVPSQPANLPGAQTSATVYSIDPNLHAPYTMQTAISVERQLSKIGNVAVSYLNSRGVHALLTRNINAPEPGTYPSNPVPPLGNIGNVYQYESNGIFKQNQLIVNANVRAGSKVSLFGYYVLNYANGDTSGPNTFPSNQYNIAADYGRTMFDVRNRVFMGGTIALPYAFRLSPFVVATSGQPFNITTGQDLNGDSIFNDRPSFSSATCPQPVNSPIKCTSLGTFNVSPSGQAIPINYGTGPNRFTLNLRLSKTFGLGKKLERPGGNFPGGGPGGPGGGPPHDHGGNGGFGRAMGGPMGLGSATNRRYSLTLGISARNLLNNVNLGTPVGTLTSPLFGQSNSLAGGPFQSASASAANRRVDLQATFTF
jgi:hypothetical protein